MNADAIIRKYGLEGHTWTNKGFHAVPFLFFCINEMPLQRMKAQYGDSHHFTVSFFKEDYANWFWRDDDMVRLRNQTLERKANEPGFLDWLLTKWKAKLTEFQAQIDKAETLDVTALSDRQLLDFFNAFYDAYLDQYGLAVGLQDPFSMHAQHFMEPAFRAFISEKGREGEFNDLYAALTAPVTPSFIDEEKASLLRVLQAAQSRKAPIDDSLLSHAHVGPLLSAHARAFYWVQNNYAKIQVLDEKHFLNELQTLSDAGIKAKDALEELHARREHAKTRKAKLIKELSIPRPLRDMIEIAEVFTYMQDERKKYVLIANHHQTRIAREVARRVKCDDKLIMYSVPTELEGILLHGKADEALWKERRKHCVILRNFDGFDVLHGPAVDELFDRVFSPKKASQTRLKGSCASPGVARGPAKILLKYHDMANVMQGDVLIASMTRPEMVPAMKKAVAIVTDEGGITSHAAIVSRELGIPCIVGTRSATKTFKTGEVIEVDANNGTVQKV